MCGFRSMVREVDIVRRRLPSVVQGSPRSRVLAWCIGLTTKIVVIVSSGCYQSTRTDSGPAPGDESAIRETRNIAAVASSLVNVYMDARVTDTLVCSAICDRLREAVTSPEAREGANRTLGDWLKASGAYDAILLLDKKGVCLACAPEGLVNQDFSGDKAFQGAVTGQLTISDAHKSEVLISLDPQSNGWTVAIGVPIKVGKDAEGVLVSYMKWSRLEALLLSVRLGQTGYVYVLNRENQVILHPSNRFYGIGLRDPRINLPDVDVAARQRVPYYSYQFKNQKTGKMDDTLVGFAYPQGYGNFSGLGWVVAGGAKRSEMGEPLGWRQLFRSCLLNRGLYSSCTTAIRFAVRVVRSHGTRKARTKHCPC